MKARRSIAVLLLLTAASVGFVPSAQAATCATGKPVMTDPKGDATPPYTAEPQLDLVRGEIAYDSKIKGLVFTMRVADLTNSPPTMATGEWYRFVITYKGSSYQIVMIGDELLDGTKRFEIGQSDGTLYSTLSTLKGKYDTSKNLLSWQLPFAAFKSATAKAIGPKATLSAISMRASANHVVPGVLAFSRTADEALAKCNYVVP